VKAPCFSGYMRLSEMKAKAEAVVKARTLAATNQKVTR
jgi:hypothetical protein